MFLKLFLAQITSASMEFPNHVWMYIPGMSLRARALGNHVVVMRAPDWPRSDIWGFPSWIKMALMAKEYGIREGKKWILMPILTNKAWKHISNNWLNNVRFKLCVIEVETTKIRLQVAQTWDLSTRCGEMSK